MTMPAIVAALAADLEEMSQSGAIDLQTFPSALALVEANKRIAPLIKRYRAINDNLNSLQYCDRLTPSQQQEKADCQRERAKIRDELSLEGVTP